MTGHRHDSGCKPTKLEIYTPEPPKIVILVSSLLRLQNRMIRMCNLAAKV